jgi:hypothetical protein
MSSGHGAGLPSSSQKPLSAVPARRAALSLARSWASGMENWGTGSGIMLWLAVLGREGCKFRVAAVTRDDADLG